MYRDLNPFLFVALVLSFLLTIWGIYSDHDNKVLAKQSNDYSYILENKDKVYSSFDNKKFSDNELEILLKVSQITKIDFMTTARDLESNPQSKVFNKKYKNQLLDLKTYVKNENKRDMF